jgi:hypothetical protein
MNGEEKSKPTRHGACCVCGFGVGTQCRSKRKKKMLLIVIYARSFYCLLPLHGCVKALGAAL